jgi:O-antigen/teichoic acid export membrane protein
MVVQILYCWISPVFILVVIGLIFTQEQNTNDNFGNSSLIFTQEQNTMLTLGTAVFEHARYRMAENALFFSLVILQHSVFRLYSVEGRMIHECGELVESQLVKETEVL